MSKPLEDVVPVVGRMLLDHSTGVGELSLSLSGLVNKGSYIDVINGFLNHIVASERDDVRRFLSNIAEGGPDKTLSPVFMTSCPSYVIGLIGRQLHGLQTEVIILDLGKYLSASESAHANQKAYQSLLRVVPMIAEGGDIGSVHSTILSELLDIAKSEFGYIGRRETNEEGKPFLRVKTMSNIAWDDKTRKIFKESAEKGFVFDNMDALFGPTIQDGTVVVVNDYDIDKRGVDTPKGHPKIRTFCGFPIWINGVLYGAVGIANNPDGYSDELRIRCEAFFSYLSELPAKVNPFRMNGSLIGSEVTDISMNKWRLFEDAELPVLEMNGNVIVKVTAKCCRLLGCLKSNLINLDVCEKPNILGIQVVETEIWKMLSGGLENDSSAPRNSILWEMPNLMNKYRYFRLTPSSDYRITEMGTIYHLSEITKDKQTIHAQKRALNIAIDSEKLQKELLNMISHELRTPLTNINIAAEIIEISSGEAAYKEQFETIYHMVAEMSEKIESVVRLGGLDDLFNKENLSEISVEPLIEEVIAGMQKEDRTRLRSCWPKLKTTKQSTVIADRGMLKTVIINIIMNALKYSESPIDICVSHLSTSTIAITVEDFGIGIPEHELDILYEPFRRASNALHVPGTGIGLSVVKKMMYKMGAQVEVTSREGRGTIVKLKFQNAQ